MLRINAFVGFQLKSNFHSSNDFNKFAAVLAKTLRRRKPPLDLQVTFGEFPPGTELWPEVVRHIRQSDLVILDISENNPNVLLEAGIAFGMNKLVVLLRSSDSTAKLPSDLAAMVFLEYRNVAELLRKKIVGPVCAALIRKLSISGGDFYFRQLWALEPQSVTYLIPGSLPPDVTGNTLEEFVRVRTYTDLDALFLISETLTRVYPEMRTEVVPAASTKELPSDWVSANLVFLGGPDYNPLVRQFLPRCPIRYLSNEEGGPGLELTRTKRRFHPNITLRGEREVVTDYGFFAKVKRSQRSKAQLIFIGGTRTWGVYGAAMFVGCRGLLTQSEADKNVRALVERLGSDPAFVVALRAAGTTEDMHPPEFDWDDLEEI